MLSSRHYSKIGESLVVMILIDLRLGNEPTETSRSPLKTNFNLITRQQMKAKIQLCGRTSDRWSSWVNWFSCISLRSSFDYDVFGGESISALNSELWWDLERFRLSKLPSNWVPNEWKLDSMRLGESSGVERSMKKWSANLAELLIGRQERGGFITKLIHASRDETFIGLRKLPENS